MSDFLQMTLNTFSGNNNSNRVPQQLDIRKLYYDQINRANHDEAPYFAVINNIHKRIEQYNTMRFHEAIYEIPLTSTLSKSYDFYKCVKYCLHYLRTEGLYAKMISTTELLINWHHVLLEPQIMGTKNVLSSSSDSSNSFDSSNFSSNPSNSSSNPSNSFNSSNSSSNPSNSFNSSNSSSNPSSSSFVSHVTNTLPTNTFSYKRQQKTNTNNNDMLLFSNNNISTNNQKDIPTHQQNNTVNYKIKQKSNPYDFDYVSEFLIDKRESEERKKNMNHLQNQQNEFDKNKNIHNNKNVFHSPLFSTQKQQPSSFSSSVPLPMTIPTVVSSSNNLPVSSSNNLPVSLSNNLPVSSSNPTFNMTSPSMQFSTKPKTKTKTKSFEYHSTGKLFQTN